MTDLRQTAQRAFEALEAGVSISPGSVLHDQFRTALEQQQAEPSMWGSGDGYWILAEDKPARPDKELFNIPFYTAPPQQQAEPVACKTLCELCVKRGYDFCANAAKTTPIIISPTPPQRKPVQKPKYMAQSNGRHSPLLTHMMNKRTALAEPEQSFEDEQRTINADEHRRANALEEAIHAAWSAGFVEGEKAALEQQAEPVCPDCKAAVLYECVACSSNNYPQQQAEPVSELQRRYLESEKAFQQQAEPVQEPFDDLATELFVVAQRSPADEGFSDTIDRIESWLREHFSTQPQRKPLTKGEIEIILSRHYMYMEDLIRAIEAAHGIKEQP